MRDYTAATGNRDPRRGLQLPNGYPLGSRVAAIRVAHSAGRLHPAIIRHVETTAPGWSWDSPARPGTKRSFGQWCDLIEAHIAKTGVSTILPFETTTGPDGTRVPIGAWVAQQRQSRLTPDQKTRLRATLPDPR